jgi:mono/diheme cytochrome c family protein
MIKRIGVSMFALLAALAAVFVVPSSLRAQSASQTLYQAKCAACHGADGTGSAVGKKLGVQDFTSADVQKMSDAELTDIIANGKNKMPKYSSLKPDEIKGLVAYIRTLKK